MVLSEGRSPAAIVSGANGYPRMSSTVCANCGTTLAGAYCHACGQHDSASHPATLGHLAHELTHELLHVDGKIWRTAVALFTRPGALTKAYWEGRRVGWIGPFRVFLLAAALHAIAVPGIGPMNWQTLIQRMPDGSLDVSISGGTERRRGLVGLPPAPGVLRRPRGAGGALLQLLVSGRRSDEPAALRGRRHRWLLALDRLPLAHAAATFQRECPPNDCEDARPLCGDGAHREGFALAAGLWVARSAA